MPPFSTLTTDEDRERKAEATGPGQYFVLANPGSFASLPEYRDEMLPISEGKFPYGDEDEASDPGRQMLLDSGDPNIVILRTFEDPARKASLGSLSNVAVRCFQFPSSSKVVILKMGTFACSKRLCPCSVVIFCFAVLTYAGSTCLTILDSCSANFWQRMRTDEKQGCRLAPALSHRNFSKNHQSWSYNWTRRCY